MHRQSAHCHRNGKHLPAHPEPRLLKKGLVYYGSILIFILGALVGKLFTDWLDIRAALLCCALLLVGFALMFIREEGKKADSSPQK